MPAPVYATALGGGLQFPLSLPYVASVSTAFTLGPNAAIGAAGASILAQIARQSAPAISTDHPVAFILIPRANVNSLGIVQSLTNAVEYTATSLSGNSLGGIAVINAGTDRGFEAGDFVSFACLAKHINDLATGKVSTGGDGSTLTGITAAQVGATTAAAVTTYVTGLGYLTTASAASTYSPLAGSSSIVTVGTLAAGAVPASLVTGTLGVGNGGNGLATATLGDLRYGSGTNTLAALAGNTAATVKVLTQTGTGTASAAPAWAPFVAGTDYLTPSGSGSGLSGVVLTSGNQSVSGIKTFTGQIKQDATGATTSIPSVLGISNLGSGTAAQFQFGNDSIVLQASFGGRLVANSFWGVEIGGNRQGSSGSASFTPGGATDPSLTVKGTTVGVPVIAAVGAASQTGKLVALRQISSTSTERNAGLIDAAWATSTDASRKGRVAVYAADSTGTDREGLRVESDGTQAMLGFYGSTAVAKQTVSGSRGSNAALASLITAIASLGFVTDSSS